MKLNDTFLKKTRPAERYQDYSDDGVPLFARIKASGEVLFFYRGKKDGVRTKLQLGTFPDMKVNEARAAALAMKDEAAKAKVAPKPRPALSALKVVTVSRAVERYLEVKADLSGFVNVKAALNNRIVPTFGDRDIKTLTRKELNQHFDTLKAEYRGAGINRVLAYTKAFLTWCEKADLIEFNPARTIDKKADEKPRDRVISDHELGYLQLAMAHMNRDNERALMLLLHTVCRKADIFCLRWKDVVERDGSIELHIPITKAKVPHIAPLNAISARYLPERPKDARDSDFVFDLSRTGGQALVRKLRSYTSQYAAKDKKEVDHFTIHDFRTAASTYLSDQKGRSKAFFTDRAMDMLLAHIPSGVTRRHYNKSDCLAERIEMLELWSNHLEKMLMKVKKNNASQ